MFPAARGAYLYGEGRTEDLHQRRDMSGPWLDLGN